MKLLLLASLLIGSVYSQICANIATFGDTDADRAARCNIAQTDEVCGCTFLANSGETCSSATCEPTPQPTIAVTDAVLPTAPATTGCDCDGEEEEEDTDMDTDTMGRRRILRRLLSSDSDSADTGDECNCGDSSDSGGDSDESDGDDEEEEEEEEEETSSTTTTTVPDTDTETDTDTTSTTTTTTVPEVTTADTDTTLDTAAVFNGDTTSDPDTNQLQQATPMGFVNEEADAQGVEEAPNQDMAGSARGSNTMCAVMAALFFAFL